MYFSVSEAELDTQCTCDKYVFQIRIVHVGWGARQSASNRIKPSKRAGCTRGRVEWLCRLYGFILTPFGCIIIILTGKPLQKLKKINMRATHS